MHSLKRFGPRTWAQCNSMIKAFIIKGSPQKAVHGYKAILLHGTFKPDHRTLSLILEACKVSEDIILATALHSRAFRTGFGSHLCVANLLFSVYLTCSCLSEAHKLFDEMPEWCIDDPFFANLMISGYFRIGRGETATMLFRKMSVRDIVTWNSMISGHVKNLQPQIAIELFGEMVAMGFEPDGFTFSTVLSACARVGSLHHGEWLHCLMSAAKSRVEMNYILNAALIDMYSKCGRVEKSLRIFQLVPRLHVSIWNSMISGLAINGHGSHALKLFDEMEKEQIVPDQVTFVSLLNGCSHCGLVEEGRWVFDVMQRIYNLKPLVEHYGSLVDLLTRAGQLEEAYSTIKSMPMEPDLIIWRTLLSGCRIHQQQPQLAEIAASKISGHGGSGSGDYVLLSNIYSLLDRRRSAEMIWETMRKKKVRKEHGLSWVEIDGRIFNFKSGGLRSHPDSKAISHVLSCLMEKLKAAGFVPVTSMVVMDVLEEEKEENLNGHSERLAVAYIVSKTTTMARDDHEGKEIRVSKNLRTCVDCHCWLKMVSTVLSRVIIVRDRVRFHRFENGRCSCGDYW
ncbi:Pentatricopeptide repeat-containing protein [Zostera marina]|uniref:Pentatricopeptide repeat-containing protein n=1 Tax=Zostera marina TaxID=29655 RepID=A0A0K9NTV2_ZOSMR|nr:Pentatricopeptide repeat-containing protein [Zostera marina]